MTGCIYRLDFASGKSYIGLTSQPLAARVKGHRHDAMRRGSKLPVHNAWRAHGEPQVSTLMVVPKDLLGVYEIIAIKAFGTMKPAGYNLSPGGEVAPSTLPGVAEKIAAAARARGISAEHRAKMVAGIKEANKDPEVRARRSAARMGHVVTEESRAKARAAMSGRCLTDDHKKKLKEARNRRGPASAETRQKMSAAHLARRAAINESV